MIDFPSYGILPHFLGGPALVNIVRMACVCMKQVGNSSKSLAWAANCDMQSFASAKRKYDTSTKMFVLPPFMATQQQWLHVSKQWKRHGGWAGTVSFQLLLCFFLLRGVKIEMEKEEEKKNMQALSAHCRGT